MANIKSAAKRVRQSLKRTARNRMRMSSVRTSEKRLLASIANKEKETAESLLKVYIGKIDKAAKKGIVHKNLASRKAGRLSKQVAAL